MAEKNIGPNLEAKASDGNPIITTGQWLDRFQQFSKREHKNDITRPLKGEDIWEVRPEALYQITREITQKQNKLDNIKMKDLMRLYTEHISLKRNTYHNRGDFFWAQQSEDEPPEEFGRILIEIEKECNFNTISIEELLISNKMTAIIDKNLRYKMMKKTWKLKKTIDLIKRNTYEKKNKKNTIPEALTTTKEKQIIKEEWVHSTKKNSVPDQPKLKFTGNPEPSPADYAMHQTEPRCKMSRTGIQLKHLREEGTLRRGVSAENK